MNHTNQTPSKINRLSELTLNGGKTLRNRIVVPPMASGTGDGAGFVTEATESHYRNLSRSQAGLIFVEYTFVHVSGRSEPRQLGVSTNAHCDGLRSIAQIIQASGALAGLQITHAGGKTERIHTGGALMAASAIPVPAFGRNFEYPDEMTVDQISEWKNAFIAAAERAQAAGFDIVEIHAAHGYGLNQFLSPITNKRCDDYGGSSDGRFRLLAEIVKGIQARCPGILTAVRIPGRDHAEAGLELCDTIAYAQKLEKLGVAVVDVSSGIGGWQRPPYREGEGYLVDDAAAIQQSLSVPVIGVGGIKTSDFIDGALESGRIALAASGRAILSGDWESLRLLT